nr:hypothetical protein [Prolixibacteraceae bacterium]
MNVKLRVLKFMLSNSSINISSLKNIPKILLTLCLISFFSFDSFSQNYKEITAKRGDGIYSIFRTNEIPYSKINEFKELNKSNLGKNDELLI